jgi:acyl carrier protein
MVHSKELHARVAKVMMEALAVGEDDVKPTSTLQGDLGAESIDMLDILFRLELEFNITTERGELFPDALFRHDDDLVHDGKLTDVGMARLRSHLPYADLGSFEKDRRVAAIPDLFTVGLVTRFVAWKLRQAAHNGQPGLRRLSPGHTSGAV